LYLIFFSQIQYLKWMTHIKFTKTTYTWQQQPKFDSMIDFWFPWYFWTIFVKISFWQNLTFGWIQFALGNDWVKSDYRFRNKKSKKKKKVEIIFCSKKNFCSCHKQATRKKLWMFQTFQMFQISLKEEKIRRKGIAGLPLDSVEAILKSIR
jgi:hypothetical protein